MKNTGLAMLTEKFDAFGEAMPDPVRSENETSTPVSGNVGRIGEPASGSDEHDDRDHDQRDGVHERSQDLRALEPEAAIRRRGPAGEEHRSCRHP